MRSPAHSHHGEAGFTLVEMLVTMTIAVVVLLATLFSLDTFSSNAAHQTRVTDANDQVRTTMDRTVADLRGASVIVRADATDLVYSVAEPAGVRTERLCVAYGDLYGASAVTSTAPAPPSEACSSGSKIASLRSTAQTAFSYDGAASSATPALVKNVGLTLSLEANTGGRTGSSTLQASAARRSSGVLPIIDSDLHATCNSGGALLSLSASLLGQGPLSVTYADDGGVSLGTPTGTTLQIPEGITTVVATVTDAAGVTNTIRRNVECS